MTGVTCMLASADCGN